MFEGRITEGSLLKKIVEAIRELVDNANLDVTENGISMQAMDSSHVALCSLQLRNDGFDHFRCDRQLSMGLSMVNISKVLKCAGNNDIITLKSEDNPDSLTLMFESAGESRISDFELKLMDIDSDHLGIPETNYMCTVKMPSGEFMRIVRDLQVIGDTCVISCTKEGIKFAVEGDLGSGKVMVRQNAAAKEEERVTIHMEEPVSLTFALGYLGKFTKATPLGDKVTICMAPDVPMVVEYDIETFGFVRYFLAPKIEDEEEE
ncbi:unnamed protein product [Chrysoparadoxa australica]